MLAGCNDILVKPIAESPQAEIPSEAPLQEEAIVVLTDEEYGLAMPPNMIPKSEHEKELLRRLGAEIAKRTEEVAPEFESAKKYSGILSTYFYEDFDGNGTYEMFAEATVIASGAVWFVNDEGAIFLDSNIAGFSVEPPILLDMQQQKFAVFKSYGDAARTADYTYSVRDGVPYETNISKHMIDGANQYGEVLVVHTTHDAFMDGAGDILGRTWKPYYFYLDEDGSFKEYGGVEVDLDFVRSMSGAQTTLEKHLPQEAIIESIYYRDNGVININYYTEERGGKAMNYITMRCDDTQALLEAAERGMYLPAVLPELAQYPAKIPQFK